MSGAFQILVHIRPLCSRHVSNNFRGGNTIEEKKSSKRNNKCNDWGLGFVQRSTHQLEGPIPNITDRSNKL